VDEVMSEEGCRFVAPNHSPVLLPLATEIPIAGGQSRNKSEKEITMIVDMEEIFVSSEVSLDDDPDNGHIFFMMFNSHLSPLETRYAPRLSFSHFTFLLLD